LAPVEVNLMVVVVVLLCAIVLDGGGGPPVGTSLGLRVDCPGTASFGVGPSRAKLPAAILSASDRGLKGLLGATRGVPFFVAVVVPAAL
jgi:hypothetical protein